MTNEDKRWAKLFNYLDGRFAGIDDKFDVVDRRFNVVDNALDNLLKLRDDDEIEGAASTMQLARHDRWIRRLADKIGLKLPS